MPTNPVNMSMGQVIQPLGQPWRIMHPQWPISRDPITLGLTYLEALVNAQLKAGISAWVSDAQVYRCLHVSWQAAVDEQEVSYMLGILAVHNFVLQDDDGGAGHWRMQVPHGYKYLYESQSSRLMNGWDTLDSFASLDPVSEGLL